MAVCRHCFQEKPMFAEKCPNCTHHSTVGEQVEFSLLTTVGGIAILFFLGWIFLG